jgi:hypothetical protein
VNRLHQLWNYARKVYDLGRRLRQTREARPYPQIPVAPVAVSLFLGALLRVPSWLKLAKKTRKKSWQRLLRYPQALNHEVFNYVSEFLCLDDLREHLYALARQAKANKALDRYKLGGYLVLALDANEPFASRSRCCEACCTRQVKVAGPDGQITEVTEYYHRAVFAHLVGADLVLDLEPIRAGEEECAAALRLLARLRRRLGVRFFDVVTVDAWYTKSPFLQAVQKLGWEAVAVLKQTDYEAYQEADALRPAQAQVLFAEEGRQVELREVRDLSLTQKPLPKVRVVLSDERWEQRQRRGKAWTRQVKQSHWRWVATEGLNHVPAKVIWQMGHGRWGIENQAFNLLTQAYHLSHCFHHHPVAIVAWLWITRLAVNRTTLFFRQWVAPRAEADFTLSDLIEELRESLACEADWERCLDSG